MGLLESPQSLLEWGSKTIFVQSMTNKIEKTSKVYPILPMYFTYKKCRENQRQTILL